MDSSVKDLQGNSNQPGSLMYHLLSQFLIAQSAAFISGIVAYPFDTLNKRILYDTSKPKGEQIYKGTIHCFKKMLREEGVRGFYRGVMVNVISVIGTPIVLVLYDYYRYVGG